MVDKTYYNCVLSQVYSPCGNYLVCGNNYGDIVVFDLKNIFNNAENSPNKVPNCSFTSPKQEQICSMVSTSRFLITGTVGAIYGWDWESVKNCVPDLSWSIQLPCPSNGVNSILDSIDVNSLFVIEDDNMKYLFAGCGDNKIYVYSLEDGKLVRTFEGHTDYLHSICHHEWQMASGSEDGSVRLWDLRQNSMTGLFEPHREPKVSRPHLGKWIGDVHMDGNYLVCGGGSRVSLRDLRSLELMTSFNETHDAGIHVTKLHGELVLAGGNDDYFYIFSRNGEVQSKIETSASTIYSAVHTDTPTEVLSLAGSSQNIDLCSDFKCRYQVLSFFQES